MDICPVTGEPCSHDKHIQVYINENNNKSAYSCCHECITSLSMCMNHLANNLATLQHMGIFYEKKCPTCNSSLHDCHISHRLGCPDCYNFFKAEIIELLPQIHGGAKVHTGKRPKFTSIEHMKKEMDIAVKEERYEDAAKLRDRIKELQQSVQGSNLEPPKIRIKEDTV